MAVQADPVAKIASPGINAVIARLKHIQGEGSIPWANASRFQDRQRRRLWQWDFPERVPLIAGISIDLCT